jgi:hypothetical protein
MPVLRMARAAFKPRSVGIGPLLLQGFFADGVVFSPLILDGLGSGRG